MTETVSPAASEALMWRTPPPVSSTGSSELRDGPEGDREQPEGRERDRDGCDITHVGDAIRGRINTAEIANPAT
jgi:hypothetical protein